MLGINNLHVDHNYDVRSFDPLKLPSEKKQATSGLGLPMPKVSEDGMKRIRVTDSVGAGGFRLSIRDKGLDIFLLVGDVKPDVEETVLSITSAKGSIELSLFPSVEVSKYLPNWLQNLVDTLELLPPTKIGLFIDTLRYIRKLDKIPSANFHKTILRTILSSHKISFSMMPDRYVIELEKKRDLLGHDTVSDMTTLLEYLKLFPETTLLQFSGVYPHEISDLIYLFLLLQQEGFLFMNYST
jgi:hypothetical protein